MRNEAYEHKLSERGLEAVGWVLTAIFLAGVLWLPAASMQLQRSALFAIVIAFAALNLLCHQLLPASSDGPLRYRRDDKALILGGAMVLSLTAYLYAIPGAPASLSSLYLLPLIGATLILQERIVLAEAIVSLLAMLFLQAVGHVDDAFWTPEFVTRLTVFAAAAGGLVAVTARLRAAHADSERLSTDLSHRLDQVHAFGLLTRQSELTPKLDELAARAGEILAEAVDAERHVIFVIGDGREDRLRPIGVEAASNRRGHDILSDEASAKILRGVLETGVPRVIDGASAEAPLGDGTIRNLLALPLRVRRATIGVACLLDRRGDGSFRPEDVRHGGSLADLAASLLNGALLFRRGDEERRAVERMAKLLIGREAKISELKGRLLESVDL